MKTNWAKVKLGEVLIERREEPNSNDLVLGKIRIIEKIGFENGIIQLRTDGTTKTGMILIRPGDLVVSGINAAKGAIAIYDDYLKPIAATIHYGAYIPNQKRVSVEFLWWLLRSQIFRDLLMEHVPGGIKTELKAKRLLNIPIPLPPLPEQRRIVAKIDELAARIKKMRKLHQETTEEVKGLSTALFPSMIQGCRSDEIQLQEACGAIIDNLHSNPSYSETGFPCVRSPDVGWGTLNLMTALKTDEEEYRRRTVRGEPQPDDIVLVREGGGAGKAAIVLPGQRFSLGQRVMMLRPNKKKVLPRFFLYQMLSPLIQEDQVGPFCKGSASPHLNIGALRCFQFKLPSISDQRQIVEKLDVLQAEINKIESIQVQTSAILESLFSSILDKAFKGEL